MTHRSQAVALAFAASISCLVQAGAADDLLRLLSSELLEIRRSTAQEPVEINETMSLEALQGASRQAIQSALGRPDNCRAGSDAQCATASPWIYVFYYLPPNWRGGGPELNIIFSAQGEVQEAAWKFSR